MDKRRQQWLADKPVFSGGNELRFSKQGGELVFGYFISSGDDGDRFMSLYKGHSVETITTKGEKISVVKFCPILSGMGEECQYCDAGNTAIKDRMSMWFYVTDILHTFLPQEKNFPTQEFGGRVYYREEIQAFKLWNSSAWKESPWEDIVRFQTLYKGLHNLQFMMTVSGAGMARRYKITAMPEPSKLPEEIYERAKSECQAIPEYLKGGTSQTQAAPQATAAATFVPGAPIQSQPMGSFSSGVATSAPAPAAESSEPMPEVKQEENPRRPLQSMF